MAPRPQGHDTAELKKQGGPIELIDLLQRQLAALLEGILERSPTFRENAGLDMEQEIERICASFTSMNRALVRQTVLSSYSFNRYVKTVHQIEPDAPKDTWEEAKKSPEIRIPTEPFGRAVKGYDFDELFGKKKE